MYQGIKKGCGFRPPLSGCENKRTGTASEDYEEGKGFTVKLNYDLGKNTSPYEFTQSRGIVIGDYIYIVDPHNGIESFDTENYKLVDASK